MIGGPFRPLYVEHPALRLADVQARELHELERVFRFMQDNMHALAVHYLSTLQPVPRRYS